MSQRIPSLRKHSSGQSRVTINGRDYYLGPHGTKASKLNYDRLIGEYFASGRSKSLRPSTLVRSLEQPRKQGANTGRRISYGIREAPT